MTERVFASYLIRQGMTLAAAIALANKYNS